MSSYLYLQLDIIACSSLSFPLLQICIPYFHDGNPGSQHQYNYLSILSCNTPQIVSDYDTNTRMESVLLTLIFQLVFSALQDDNLSTTHSLK